MIRAGETPDGVGDPRLDPGRLAERGLAPGVDCIVAVNEHAANPHYGPTRTSTRRSAPGDLVLIDLWGKETDESIFADQTWMAWVGERGAGAHRGDLARGARRPRGRRRSGPRRWAAGEPVFGYEVDDAAREVIQPRLRRCLHPPHRPLHRPSLHGSGPNIDNLETRDTRRLIPGVGFSIEPGIYLTGDVGFRTEIDVYMGPTARRSRRRSGRWRWCGSTLVEAMLNDCELCEL
jgi:Xaa-Pro dipeptidase